MTSQVKSAARVLELFEYFGSVREPKHLKDIVSALAFPKSSTFMLLRTLVERGYIERGLDDRYILTPAFRGSAHGWVGGHLLTLVRAAEPVMQRMVEELQETNILAILTPDLDVRVISSVLSPLVIRYDITETPVLPTYCTSLGQAMLAYSDEDVIERYIKHCSFEALTKNTITDAEIFRERLKTIKGRGYSIHIEERFPAASSAAVPIFNNYGDVVAALNIASVTTRFRRKHKRIIEALLEAGAEIMMRKNGGVRHDATTDHNVGANGDG